MSYLDIDQILYEEERIPSIFLINAYALSYLDPTLEEHTSCTDLPEQTRIELPLWLAMTFKDKHMIDIDLPKHYQKKMRDEILAGAETINLKEFSHYYFDVGIHLAMKLRNNDLKEILQIAFASGRFRSLMMHALSSWNDDLTAFAQNLTATEYYILNEGLSSSKDLHQWRLKRSSILKKSSILGRRPNNNYDSNNINKRK